MAAIAARVPWWAKIAIKLALSRLPVAYRLWKRLGIFRHGYMDDVGYARRVLSGHLERVGLPDLQGKTALELGPGDTVLSGLLAADLGASRTYLVDAGAFADTDPAAYVAAADAGALELELPADPTFADLLRCTRTEYLTSGLASLRALPADSVHFSWSQAVLEHVRRHEFADTMRELHRVLAPGAVSSHTVDLKDHLQAGLNNLRFRSSLWERERIANAGFYTNRLGMTEIVDAMRAAGFDVEVTEVRRWTELPIRPAALAPEFRSRSRDELLVQGFDVVLRKRPAA